jgi:hypothetical protein
VSSIRKWVDAHANLPTRARWIRESGCGSQWEQSNGICVDSPFWRVSIFDYFIEFSLTFTCWRSILRTQGEHRSLNWQTISGLR